MNTVSLVVIYVAMLAFDLAVLAGTAWLVSERGWSAWWFALAVLMCIGSYPGKIMEIAQGCKV